MSKTKKLSAKIKCLVWLEKKREVRKRKERGKLMQKGEREPEQRIIVLKERREE